MKPIRIEMTNFGPYRREVLDFSSLDENSLFLISGRTGAGKSSIFDAMTYALYDKTSSDRPVNELRSSFAELKDPRTKVVFYFEHHNQLYRLERELDLKPRKGLDRGKGIGTSKASLSVVDGVGGLELDKLAGKPKDTNQAVVDLLRLTSEQFKQIILLPQYQFSQFLKSPTSEKIPILRQIFGTQVFAQFEENLAHKWSQAKQKQSQFQTNLDAHFASQIWTPEERTTFAELTSEQRLSQAHEHLQHYQKELTAAKQKKAVAEKSAREADLAYQAAQGLAAQFQDRRSKQVQYQEQIVDQAEDYQKKQAKLNQLNFAAGLSDLVKEENSKQKRAQELDRSQTNLQEEVAKRQEKLAPLDKQLVKLQGQKIQAEKSQAEIENLSLALSSAQTLTKQTAELTAAELGLKKLADDQKKLLNQEQELSQNKADLEASLISEQELQDLKEIRQEAQHLIDGDLSDSLQKLAQLQEEQKSLSDRQVAIGQAQDKLESDLIDVRSRLKTMKQDQLKLMVAKLQTELEEGSPCPVCGSFDHPGVQVGSVDEETLVDLSQKVEDLEAQLVNKQEALQAKQFEADQLKSQLADNRRIRKDLQENLASSYQILREKTSSYLSDFIWETAYSDYFGQVIKHQLDQQYQDIVAKKTKQIQQLEQLTQNLASLDQIKQKVQQDMAGLSGQIKTLKQSQSQLNEVYPDLKTPDYYQQEIANRREAYQQFRREFESCQQQVASQKEALSSLQGRLASLTESLQANRADLKALTKQLESKLADSRALTHERSELQEWLTELAAGQQLTLQAWLTEYQQHRRSLEASLADLNQVLADQSEPDLLVLAQQKEEAESALNQAASQLALSEHHRDQVVQLVAEIENIVAQAGHHLEKFSQLTQLKNIISGTETGSQRLKLETYVIQAYLEEILTYANDHYIGLLSNQQFEFLIGREGSGNSQSGLEINIYDRTNNKELPAASLSGGETFIASLAIALSMSEVVQNTSNGALVETLFIDEGFGSLDEDTLDKAIAVLEQIGQNRMVGVISHVKEMKDTIQQQVLIEKGLDGSSRIKVKATSF
ncbi:AAA family ATPase [Streptococcus tangpeifui]|uniref:AAA family ATPase n=1 Tax=Streptococcus tangpeifui TaxID=2709400 RepID=UPI0013EA4E5A|nr:MULTISPECIES: SMC family ATPase [unclassified Streptococcus]